MPWRTATALLFVSIIAMMVLEAAVLALLWRYRGRGVPLLALLVNLLAGASLLLAATVAVLGTPGPWLAASLLIALLMHIADLRLRWQPRALRPVTSCEKMP